jgi:lysophospholipase L1-like esterase
MKFAAILFLIFLSYSPFAATNSADANDYLNGIKIELQKQWPRNKTINMVFHGHSVPAGYFKTPLVNTFDSYPYLVLKELKKHYPYAVINIINTSIGGEESNAGAKRFKSQVLPHQSDVLFIDYALNDRRIGLDEAKKAWEKMIKKALKKNIKIILLTPSPDKKLELLADDTILDQHAEQIRALAEKYHVGLADSYAIFKKEIKAGQVLSELMSQGNHPNEKGHSLIAEGIMKYFN